MTLDLGRTGAIGRFKPINHLGKRILTTLCENSDEVVIGIGSSNKYDYKNPMTSEETEEMIRRVMKDFSNYKIVHVPDSGHIPEYRDGRKWIEDVKSLFGELDFFATGNPYVAQLLSGEYKIIHPFAIMPADERIVVKSSEIRRRMVSGEEWENLVPEEVVNYFKENNLAERIKREFGEKILSAGKKGESLAEEKLNIAESG